MADPRNKVQPPADLARAPEVAEQPRPGPVAEVVGNERRAQVQIATVQRTTFHAGPLPDPQTLAEYAKINPQLVDRIVAMAETQAASRQDLERRVVQGEIDGRRHSVNAALTVALAALVVACICAVTGHETTAAIIAGLDIGGLVSAFLVRQWRAARAEAEAEPPPKDTGKNGKKKGKGSKSP